MASTFISLPSSSIAGPIDVILNPANDAVKISDGTDTLAINPDGSINVSGISINEVDALVVGINEFEYGEANSLAIGGTAIAVSHVFPDEYKLRKVSCTGDSIGVFTVLFNGAPVDKKRSTYTNFNCELDYETGITIPAGTTVEVEVENASASSIGDFSAQLLFSAK